MKLAGIENCAEKKVDIQGVKPVAFSLAEKKYYVYGVVEPGGTTFPRNFSLRH